MRARTPREARGSQTERREAQAGWLCPGPPCPPRQRLRPEPVFPSHPESLTHRCSHGDALTSRPRGPAVRSLSALSPSPVLPAGTSVSFQNMRLGCKSSSTSTTCGSSRESPAGPAPAGDGGGLWAPPLGPRPWAAPLTPGPPNCCSRCACPAPEAALTWALLAQPGPCRLVSVAGALQSHHSWQIHGEQWKR